MAVRTANPTARSRRRPSDWKEIDQSVKPRAMSSVAERKIWLRRSRIAALTVAILMVLAASIHFISYLGDAPSLLTKAGESLPIQRVTLQSDGFISTAWALKQLDWQEGQNLLSVDIAGMKENLEQVGQIKSAQIERVFPDELRIRLEERVPVARIIAQRASGEKLLLYVDAEGFVFEGVEVAATVARGMPSLAGISLSREDDHYSKIEGMPTVAKLLEDARVVAPHIYRSWTTVSLAEYPQIVVKSKFARSAVFTPEEDFRTQLARLDYILDHYRGQQFSQIARVDLTLGTQVPVKSVQANR